MSRLKKWMYALIAIAGIVFIVLKLSCHWLPSCWINSTGITKETHPFCNQFMTEFYKPLNATHRKRGPSFLITFFLLEQKALRGQKDFLIVETGSLRTEPINIPADGASTIIFDAFLKIHNGALHTVDLDPKCQGVIRKYCSEKVIAYTSDSVKFLETFNEAEKIDVLYLDSFDLDVTNPEPSAEHHLKEIEIIFDRLKKGTIIIVDDNLVYKGKPVGKGYLVEKFLKDKGVPMIFDGYQKVFQIAPDPKDIEGVSKIRDLTSSLKMRFFFQGDISAVNHFS